MRLPSPLQSLASASLIAVLTASLTACGDSGGTSETTGPSTGAPSTGDVVTETGPVTTGSSSTAEPTTGGTGGQTESGSSSGGGSSSSSSSSTGEPGTDTGPGTDTASSSSSSSGDSSGSSSGTGGDEVMPCVTDEDCTLVDDCCSCEPIGPGEAPPKCDVQQCFVNTCNGYGLEGAPVECHFGRCTFAKIGCNPLGVNCNAPKPMCPPGQVPSVLENDDGKCWSGNCVPAEACDWVPDCSYCDEDELVCVGKLQKGAYSVCEAKPVDCGDSDDIDCGCGQQICDAMPPHTVCSDAQDDINCECPFC